MERPSEAVMLDPLSGEHMILGSIDDEVAMRCRLTFQLVSDFSESPMAFSQQDFNFHRQYPFEEAITLVWEDYRTAHNEDDWNWKPPHLQVSLQTCTTLDPHLMFSSYKQANLTPSPRNPHHEPHRRQAKDKDGNPIILEIPLSDVRAKAVNEELLVTLPEKMFNLKLQLSHFGTEVCTHAPLLPLVLI